MASPIAVAYADCIDVPCPECQAPQRQWCMNPINQRPKAIACLARYKAAETPRPH